MPDTPDPRRPRTRLAWARKKAGLTQRELSDITGIPRATLQRLERGEFENPKLRYLVNCSIALGVELDEVIEDRWREWLLIDAEAPNPTRVSARSENQRRSAPVK